VQAGRTAFILVTGPTGSGKTTTLYSTLKRIATEEVNVSTVEDPIEMIEPSFNQTQVQPQLDFSFAEGLRALMRQDPDILMVGEIRDLATARDGGSGRPDRPPGVLDLAHQRCAVRDDPLDGAGCAGRI
jgi:type II secretory ATPase GspE/PulE/Tfp pilus assembly ATPase PilB-like protein